MVKAITTTIQTHMKFPTLKDLTPMKSNVPYKILTPPTKVEAFKDLTLLKQGHPHDFEIGIDPIFNPYLFSSQLQSNDLIRYATLEFNNFDSTQSSRVQFEVIFPIH
jgi:hypothetical protein